jgi:SAM-dependent methyltransferase
VIAKLAVDCWQPANNMYANGGKNWFEALKTFEANSSFRLYKNTLIDPLLAVADVMVTDVSSVAFEFLVLGKPVVYIDTPRFFTEYLKMYFPHEDTEKWKDIAYINAGRKYGTLVDNLDDLPGAIESALARGHSIDKAIEMRKLFLYNPGRSAETMVEAMHEIYMDNRHFRNSMAYRLINKAISFFPKFSGRMRRSMAKRILGGRANWLGLDYINCKDTVRAAAKAGLSINDYLERGELSPRKRGRRDRIIAEMDKRGLLDVEGGNILEIGAGTGRFLEKTIARRPRSYEIYEIDKGWSRHIESAYGCFKDVNLLVREADGVSLKDTPTSSLDYVYAHGVFVYTPIIVTAGYLREMARVCNMGAKVVFDAYYDADWSFRTIRAWAHAGHLFPVVLPRNLLEAIFADLGFDIIAEFTEIHGASCSRYIALKKVVEKSL